MWHSVAAEISLEMFQSRLFIIMFTYTAIPTLNPIFQKLLQRTLKGLQKKLVDKEARSYSLLTVFYFVIVCFGKISND